MDSLFRIIAKRISRFVGTAKAFIIAVLFIIAWAITGPLFDFSDTWQLVINTSTTIVTFLMVFLIQNTQNREAKAVNLKLDELIKAYKTADNKMIDIDDLTDADLAKLEEAFKKVAREKS